MFYFFSSRMKDSWTATKYFAFGGAKMGQKWAKKMGRKLAGQPKFGPKSPIFSASFSSGRILGSLSQFGTQFDPPLGPQFQPSGSAVAVSSVYL